MSGARPARISAPWLAASATQAVFAAFTAAGFKARAVGGIVRNTFLGLPATDIDIATDAKPEDTLRLANVAGFKTIPTGLAHGTVTVIAAGTHFEVTTLRRDVATDGRHAEVAFTSDWAADASRRDFTINALYCDADGTVFDPLSGCADLDPIRIRFIGEPQARIAEDYLRILRFFRFTAAYSANGVLDSAGLAACRAGRAGLAQISGERIQVELFKLLTAPQAVSVTRALVECGVWASIVEVKPRPDDLARLVEIEDRLGVASDPIRRLAALAVSTPEDASRLDARLKLSVSVRARLTAAARNAAALDPVPDDAAAQIAAYRMGIPGFTDGALIAWARSGRAADDAQYLRLATLPARFTPPALPVTGRDLIDMGYEAGPRLGAVLEQLEVRWLEGGFAPDRDGLLALARAGLPR